MPDYIDVSHEPIPYSVYELAQARGERREKRMWIAIVVAIVLLFASNMAWLAYMNEFDTISLEQDGEGVNTMLTSVFGGIHNGAESQAENQEEAEH